MLRNSSSLLVRDQPHQERCKRSDHGVHDIRIDVDPSVEEEVDEEDHGHDDGGDRLVNRSKHACYLFVC